jgi:adenosylhomocysteine nucleosidase
MQTAASKAQAVLDCVQVDRLVIVGIAGGIGPSVAIGDLVVPERVTNLATGAEYQPEHLGMLSPRGILATSEALLGDTAEAARLERLGIIAVDMESAAIAQVCALRQVPWSVFRSISDRADDGSTDQAVLSLAGPDGRPRLRAVLRFVLTRPGRIPQLYKLARGLSLATNAAATAAAQAIEGEYAA